MSTALAEAILPGVAIYEHDPRYYSRELMRVAHWAVYASPFVGVDEEVSNYLRDPTTTSPPYFLSYGITLDITGTERCHKGEGPLAESLVQGLLKRGIVSRIAIGNSIGAAWALSRFAKDKISFATSFNATIGELSLRALRIPEDITGTLHELGIKTIYDVLALPRSSLGVRFGPILLQRINQILGHEEEVYTPILSPPSYSATREFDIPLTRHESIVAASLEILKKIVGELIKKKESAKQFLITMESLQMDNSIEVLRKEVSLYAAQSGFTHIQSILSPVLESIRTPQGIQKITISAPITERTIQNQGRLDGTHDNESALQSVHALCNSLLAGLGPARVTTAQFIPSHIPERSFSYRTIEQKTSPTSPMKASPMKDKGFIIKEGRPPYLLDTPEQVEVLSMLPDKAPSRVTWDGLELKIVRGIGPERIANEWWREEIDLSVTKERDYFRIQDETGRWLWIFRNKRTMEWFVQGVWV